MDASGGIGSAATTPLRRDSADGIASRSDRTEAIRPAARNFSDPGLGGGPGHGPPSETT
jgi:hypothetical protein